MERVFPLGLIFILSFMNEVSCILFDLSLSATNTEVFQSLLIFVPQEQIKPVFDISSAGTFMVFVSLHLGHMNL